MTNTHENNTLKIEFEEFDFGKYNAPLKFTGKGWLYTVTKEEKVISNYVLDDENITDDEVTWLEGVIGEYKSTFKPGTTPVVDKTLFK